MAWTPTSMRRRCAAACWRSCAARPRATSGSCARRDAEGYLARPAASSDVRARHPNPLFLVPMALALVAGCLGGTDVPSPGGPIGGEVRIVDAQGEAVPYAQVSVVRSGALLSVASAD